MTPVSLPHDWFPRPVPGNVRIGERSWFYSAFGCLHLRSRLAHAVSVGRDSGIYNGTFFDLGPTGEVQIGDYCTIVGAIFCANSRIVIGDYTFIAHDVVLADSAFGIPFEERSDRPAASTSGTTTINVGNNCWIGARAVLLAGAVLGEGAIVGAGAVVDCEVPAYTLAAGNPARIVETR